jgi:crotonobetainyl-CoA:carnitine CoA-transferase CaiB-like acyl-CoA transferase
MLVRGPGLRLHLGGLVLEDVAAVLEVFLGLAVAGGELGLHATIYPYGPFPTGDGGTVMMGLQNEREWTSFCQIVLQRPDLATDPRFAGNAGRVAERDALRQLIVDAFAALSAPQVLDRLEAAKIANAR